MRRVVEYRNLTFASSDDGILQIWFEAQCDEENLLVRIYGQSRDTSFERITPQVLTGWALYRSSKPKGLVSGIYASLRPYGSGDGALTAVERHLRMAKEMERHSFLAAEVAGAIRGETGKPIPQEVLDAIMSARQRGDFVDEIMRWFRGEGGKNAE